MVSSRHSWKFGFDFLNTEDYVRYLRNQNGTYEYPDFTSFALDFSGNTLGARNWSAYSQRFGSPVFDQTVRDYSLFTEDQFRVNSRLTVHYGLRYEYSTLPQPKLANPDFPQSGHIRSVATNFAPRLGLALAFDHARSVLRGGYGIFYARYHTGLITTFFEENGLGQPSVDLETRFLADPTTGPIFPNVLKAPIAGSAVDLTVPSSDYRNPYTHQADVALEHALSADWKVTVSGLFSRALHLTTVRDLNVGNPSTTVAYEIDDAAGKAVGSYTTPAYRLVNRINPDWRRVNSVESGGNSYYNGLVLCAAAQEPFAGIGRLPRLYVVACYRFQSGRRGRQHLLQRWAAHADQRRLSRREGLVAARSAAPAGGELELGAEDDGEDIGACTRAWIGVAALADFDLREHAAGYAHGYCVRRSLPGGGV